MELKEDVTMSLSKGYKLTEIGFIPDNWEQVSFDDISKNIIGGGTPSRSITEYWGREIPWVTVKDFATFNPSSTQEYITLKGLKSSASNLIKKGTLITSTRMALGKAVIYDVDVAINQDLKAIYTKNNITTGYLYCWFEFNSKYIEELGSGSTVMGLSLPELKKIQIPLPPLPEQKAIAQLLSDTDNLIQALDKKLAKKRAIKQGVMQQLLTPKEDWEVRKLGELAKYRRGSFPQPYGLPQWYDENNGTPFIQVYDVDKNMRLKSTTKQKISDLAKDKSVFVEKGNIILTIQGSIGRIALTQYDAYVDRTLLIFTDYKVPIDKVFFSYVIQEKFRIEKENAPGGIIKTITKEALSKFDIPLPKTLEEQFEIGLVLSDMDAEIAQLEKKLNKYKLLKQGLMQELLTGKIRLV